MSGETMNVPVIVPEGAWVDHMRGYGDEGETTPFLDELARQEVRFANASRTAASALPAVASLLTGLFPRPHGATDVSLAEFGRGNQIDTNTAPADALGRALYAWLSDTERRMRDHNLDGTVGAAAAAARCAAVE